MLGPALIEGYSDSRSYCCCFWVLKTKIEDLGLESCTYWIEKLSICCISARSNIYIYILLLLHTWLYLSEALIFSQNLELKSIALCALAQGWPCNWERSTLGLCCYYRRYWLLPHNWMIQFPVDWVSSNLPPFTASICILDASSEVWVLYTVYSKSFGSSEKKKWIFLFWTSNSITDHH